MTTLAKTMARKIGRWVVELTPDGGLGIRVFRKRRTSMRFFTIENVYEGQYEFAFSDPRRDVSVQELARKQQPQQSAEELADNNQLPLL